MSALEAGEVDTTLAFDAAWAARARHLWGTCIALAVFGDLHAPAIGALPRLRKRTLDCGEKLRALLADRAWIPRPRERLKSALAASLGVAQSVAQLRQSAAELDDGTDRAAFDASLEALAAHLAVVLEVRANDWAALLDRRSDQDHNSED